MTNDPDADPDSDDEPDSGDEPAMDGDYPSEGAKNAKERVERNEERDRQPVEGDGRQDRDGSSDEDVEGEPTSAGSAGPPRLTDQEPDVSVTIEGKYDSVFERLEHPRALQHSELDVIAANIESTLLAVARSGGGIRSQIYEAVDFELDDPWAIRIYLEVLEMHDLVRLQDDRWVPSDAPDRDDGTDESP